MKLIDLLVKELPKRGGWPEGAVECERFMVEATIDFYDKDGNWHVDCGEEYGAIAVECINPREAGDGFRKESVKKDEYESALAASQQSAWNGEGLPPVGCECEARYLYATNAEWFAFRCIAVDCEVAFGWGGKEPTNLTLEDFEFRPIFTEAERKRKDTAQEMCNLFGNGIRIDEKAGYGTTWLEVYDAIAAGKIPNITLK